MFQVSGFKWGFSILAICLMLISSCNSGTKKIAPTEPAKGSGVGKFVFSEEIHNFGPLKAGEIVTFTFLFHNGGTKSLTITSVDSGCGCTEVNVPVKTIGPGQEGQIEVIYNSSGEVGKQLKTITLFSNASEPKKLIYIKANITNEIIEINS